RGTPEREITEPDVVHEAQALLDLWDEILRDHLLLAPKTQFAHERQRFARGTLVEVVDRLTLHPHVARDRIQARAATFRAGPRFFLLDVFKLLLRLELALQ